MEQLLMNVCLIGKIIGLIIFIKMAIDLNKIDKQLRSMKENELILEDIREKRIKKLKIMLAGSFLFFISDIISIFLR